MKLIYLEETSSTHTYLKEYINKNGYTQSVSIITQNQTSGIGSRDNSWNGKEGNLFFSFVIDIKKLPKDLALQSSSIYFSYILKNILKEFGSKVILKWPNDFYIENKKIGGTITSISGNLIYCGIGLNLVEVSESFGYLDIDIDVDKLLNEYFSSLEEYPSWKQIFSKFEIEFKHNNDFKTNIKDQKILLKNVILQDDGSLFVDGEKVFSLR